MSSLSLLLMLAVCYMAVLLFKNKTTVTVATVVGFLSFIGLLVRVV